MIYSSEIFRIQVLQEKLGESEQSNANLELEVFICPFIFDLLLFVLNDL